MNALHDNYYLTLSTLAIAPNSGAMCESAVYVITKSILLHA